MSNITISDLQPADIKRFSDSEGYLKELSEQELGIQGGIWHIVGAAMALTGAFGVGVCIGRALVS